MIFLPEELYFNGSLDGLVEEAYMVFKNDFLLNQNSLNGFIVKN